MIKYIEGDIHDVIKTLETDSIDFIYTDPPFGTTQASWDKGLNWEGLFVYMLQYLSLMNYYNLRNQNIIIRGKKIK